MKATENPPTDRAAQAEIVQAIDLAIRSLFPEKYFGLCHAYAIVGANVASIELGRDFRPVAGLAIIDAGAGRLIKLTDNDAFSKAEGGAYHCWIEAAAPYGANRELIDISYMHNQAYAKKHNVPWCRGESSFIWGRFNDFVINGEPDRLPYPFPHNRLWLRETREGAAWMVQHIHRCTNEYVKITALALKMLNCSRGGLDVAEAFPLQQVAFSQIVF